MQCRQIVAAVLTATALSIGGCSRNLNVLGPPVTPLPTATGHADVPVWRKFGQLQLPDAQQTTIDAAITRQLLAAQPQPCQADPATVKLEQQALFNHLARLLKDRPQKDLSPFAVGPLSHLPPQCQRLILLTGRLGGAQPGWLAAGMLSVREGRLLRFAVIQTPSAESVTQSEVLALSGPLIASLNGASP